MKNTLELLIIEEGRLISKEEHHILTAPFCYPTYNKTCANYINCMKNQYGYIDFDGKTFVDKCQVGNGSSYSECSWGKPQNAFSVINCNIAGYYNVCNGELQYKI